MQNSPNKLVHFLFFSTELKFPNFELENYHMSAPSIQEIRLFLKSFSTRFGTKTVEVAPESAALTFTELPEDMLKFFPFPLTGEQYQLLLKLWQYLQSDTHCEAAILTGAAGTGKTSLLCGLAKYLRSIGERMYLAAPTGRAARVFGTKAGIAASTIHRLIYRPVELTDSKGELTALKFELKEEEIGKKGIFMLDEASMLSDESVTEGLFQFNSLLDDVLRFIFEKRPGNKLIFLGDPYQLPPVKANESPALNAQLLQTAKNTRAFNLTLTEVKRQGNQSAILNNAHVIRDLQKNATDDWQFTPEWDEQEVIPINSLEDAANRFVELYRDQPDETIFICYSNAMATKINRMIRKRLYGHLPPLPMPGEQLMVVRNHYMGQEKDADLIANGEQCTLSALDLITVHKHLNLDWAEVALELTDYLGKTHVYTYRALLSLLERNDPRLSEAEYKLMLLWAGMERKKAEKTGIADTTFRYLNALQLKYGYCITGHKSQGGEWKNVFLFLERQYGDSLSYLRWLYTTFTRASGQLFLVNG